MTRYTSKILKLTLASLTGFLIFPSQSWAVPGQPISEAVRWSTNHTLISKLMLQEKYEEGEPDYNAKGETSNATFSLYIWLDPSGRIATENIDYRNKGNIGPLRFERANENGNFFLEQMYGKALAEDFKSARYVRKIKDNLSWENNFYLGKRFAYQCMNNDTDGIYQITLIKTENLNKHIQGMLDYKGEGG